MAFILRLIPSRLIRFVGDLQFKFPILRPLINKTAQVLAGSGAIQRGAGRGLKFNARGCNPGYLAGTSQPLEQELVLRYSPPGGVVYDLGANAGFYAIIAAKAVGPSGMVYAFEPSPKLCERIRENVASNAFNHVEVVQAAVFKTDGEVDFGIVGDLSVSNSIRAAGDSGATRVQAVRLDTFSPQHRPPNLILIDIEGAEIDALDGALRTIQRHQPVIMVEVHWLGERFTNFFHEKLEPLGYRGTTYDGLPFPAGTGRYHALLLPPGGAPAGGLDASSEPASGDRLGFSS